ncbi:hypothetical protein LCGC14_0541840 [marine sediment metagenome]|uniref:TET-Associated Glycosyltransferase domain-containing protein n=1 Tax=marine sediment metagenome TaxID=412755 RepID=A0A0F9SB35_9ZZZZ
MSKIIIPSYRRANRLMKYNDNHTIAYIDPVSMRDTFLFIREEEKDNYNEVALKYGCSLILLHIPKSKGIPETRDAILDYARDHEVEKLIMIDDDLQLNSKPDAKTYIRMRSERNDFAKMVTDLEHFCSQEFPVVGITARQFSMEKTKSYDINTRIIQVYCLYMPIIKTSKIRFSDAGFPFMTDYYFILSLLQAGHKNLCLNTYCRDDRSQTSGGCKEMRTAENQSKSAVGLYKKFPDLVTLYQKETGTWQESRINVRIAWRKTWKNPNIE